MSLIPHKSIPISKTDLDIIFNLADEVEELGDGSDINWELMRSDHDNSKLVILIYKTTSISLNGSIFMYDMTSEMLGAILDYDKFMNTYIPLLRRAKDMYNMNVDIDELIEFYKSC